MKILKGFFKSGIWNFIVGIIGIFTYFGVTSEDLIATYHTWGIKAVKWSIIFGAFIFAIHAYVRAEKNRKHLKSLEDSDLDKAGREAYNLFVSQLRYALARYRDYKSGLGAGDRKYTPIGVMERINEVKAAEMQLLPVCGGHVRSLLLKMGDEWLEDIEEYVKTAPLVEKEIWEEQKKDRR